MFRSNPFGPEALGCGEAEHVEPVGEIEEDSAFDRRTYLGQDAAVGLQQVSGEPGGGVDDDIPPLHQVQDFRRQCAQSVGGKLVLNVSDVAHQGEPCHYRTLLAQRESLDSGRSFIGTVGVDFDPLHQIAVVLGQSGHPRRIDQSLKTRSRKIAPQSKCEQVKPPECRDPQEGQHSGFCMLRHVVLKGGQRIRGGTAVDDGGDAAADPHLVRVNTYREDMRIDMGVEIDQTWNHEAIRGVDGPGCGPCCQIRAQL